MKHKRTAIERQLDRLAANARLEGREVQLTAELKELQAYHEVAQAAERIEQQCRADTAHSPEWHALVLRTAANKLKCDEHIGARKRRGTHCMAGKDRRVIG